MAKPCPCASIQGRHASGSSSSGKVGGGGRLSWRSRRSISGHGVSTGSTVLLADIQISLAKRTNIEHFELSQLPSMTSNHRSFALEACIMGEARQKRLAGPKVI